MEKGWQQHFIACQLSQDPIGTIRLHNVCSALCLNARYWLKKRPVPREYLILDACVLHIHVTIICDSDVSVLSKVIVRTKSEESAVRLMFLT